ncbi:MAG: DUF58 domain-containing protein, partial [Candidatus Margulisiibacteriota bacterium]
LRAGVFHTLALTKDGRVFAWGHNDCGQLGLGDVNDHTQPTEVAGLRDVAQLVAGDCHTLALTKDGRVFAWGHNGFGQLGLGDTKNRTQPIEVKGLRDIAQIVAGSSHAFAITKDGRVFAWGNNGFGQLGLGDVNDHTQPTEVVGLRDVVQLRAGVFHTLALTKDGRVFAWGHNDCGQLGLGDVNDRTQPTEVAGLRDVAQFAVGSFHTFALTKDGRVFAWGNNDYGQLGLGDTSGRKRPTEVAGLHDVAQLVAGERHTFALTKDGRVFAWGLNDRGMLGLGDTKNRTQPTEVETQNYQDRTGEARGIANDILKFIKGQHGRNGIKVEGLFGGSHIGRRPVDRGFDFAGFREFVPGEDDAANIDWIASERVGKKVVRDWHPDQNRRLIVVVDPALFDADTTATVEEAKRRVANVAGLVAGTGLNDKEMVSVAVGGEYLIPGGMGEKHLPGFVSAILEASPVSESRLVECLKEPALQKSFVTGTRVVLIADFRQRNQKLEQTIRALRAKGVTVNLVDMGPAAYTFKAPVVVMGGLEMEVDEETTRQLCERAAGVREQKRLDFLRAQGGRRIPEPILPWESPLAKVSRSLRQPVGRNFDLPTVHLYGEERLVAAGGEGGFDLLADTIKAPNTSSGLLCCWKTLYPGMFALYARGRRRLNAPAPSSPCSGKNASLKLLPPIFYKWLPELRDNLILPVHEPFFGPSHEEFEQFIRDTGKRSTQSSSAGLAAELYSLLKPAPLSMESSFKMRNSEVIDRGFLGINRRLARVSRWLTGRDQFLAEAVATRFDPQHSSYMKEGITLSDFEPREGEPNGPRVEIRFARRARKIMEKLKPLGAGRVSTENIGLWQRFLSWLFGSRTMVTLAGKDPKAVRQLQEIPLDKLRELLPTLFGEEQATLLTCPTVDLRDLGKETEEKWTALLARINELKVKDAIAAIRDFVIKTYRYFPYQGQEIALFEAVTERAERGECESSNDQVRLAVALGGGKCVELSAITLALLRAAGIPSALFVGYTADGVSIVAESHQWAGVVLKDPVSGRLFHHPVETAGTPRWRRMWKELLVKSVSGVSKLIPDIAIAAAQKIATIVVAAALVFPMIFRWITGRSPSPAELAAPSLPPEEAPPSSGKNALHEVQVMVLGKRETRRRALEEEWQGLKEE